MALTCMKMVLITKGGGEYIWIVLVQVIWKICALIMNNRFRSATTLQYKLHGFIQGRGTVTATMEENLAHQLAGLCHKPIFQFSLDVRKSYDSLDRGRCTEILWGYFLGSNLKRLLNWY